MASKPVSAVHRHRGARVLGVEIAVVGVEGCKSAVVAAKVASARERWRPSGEGKERRGLEHWTAVAAGNLASEVTCN